VRPNFVLLDSSREEVARLIGAMVQERDAVARRSWSHPAEPVTEEWWHDVLPDPRARRRDRRDRSTGRSPALGHIRSTIFRCASGRPRCSAGRAERRVIRQLLDVSERPVLEHLTDASRYLAAPAVAQ
jgi:hypothetical protein